MPKKLSRELYRNIEEGLTERDFLRKMGMSKRAMLSLLSGCNWREKAFQAVTTEKIDCRFALKLCEDTLDTIGEAPKEGWMEYSFRHTLQKLFPDGMDEEETDRPEYEAGRLFYNEALTILLEFDRKKRPFNPVLDMDLLPREGLEKYSAGDEYVKLLDNIRDNYVHAFMRISMEISPYNTWGHICGVHYVAMHVARQLEKAKVPIDLALTSGAAASHDIGKFGVKEKESGRIPYLHYYYTSQCLNRGGMPLIAHIASNHSTWDLELENLSVESLILIYADFRVKSTRTKSGEEIINFYSLDDAFEVILGKLDNVDKAKKARYTRVYRKLHDFEKYMEHLGVSTNLGRTRMKQVQHKDAALLRSGEAVERLKYLAIEHNIKVMNSFNSEVSFGTILEDARSEKLWKNIRAYINTLQEYFTYMTQKQKQLAISFLFDLLAHREGDIRRQAAALLGKIIATYDETYRKELPEGVLDDFLNKGSEEIWRTHLKSVLKPELQTTEQQRRWIGYTLMITLESLLHSASEEDGEKYLRDMIAMLPSTLGDREAMFISLNTLLSIPLHMYTGENIRRILEFAKNAFRTDDLEVKVAVFRWIKHLVTRKRDLVLSQGDMDVIMSLLQTTVGSRENAGIIYLKYTISDALKIQDEMTDAYRQMLYEKGEATSDIFRENLKVGTPWIIKAVNIELLLDELKQGTTKEVFYIGTHLSNLLKVSERVTVRHSAGAGLVEIFELLNLDQRNEIVVELTKGLEIGEYQFSKYIPEYLGVLVLKLHPNELNEAIRELGVLLESRNDRVASVTLNTLGEILKNYSSYEGAFDESKEAYEVRKKKILGMILRGMANYHEVVNQEAFMVMGQYIFGTEKLDLREKFDIFKVVFKKMLTLVEGEMESQLTFFNNAAALNHIYRFISDYDFYIEKMKLTDNRNVAFFPGTFDPFSLSHKAIVKTIRDMGYDVYLALDEFSWSKRTQPRKIRRKIVTMSVADEFGVYIFPDNEPINIANPEDLKKLRRLLSGKDTYIVVGSDVVSNASSYLEPPVENSIHSLNHIIFKRISSGEGDDRRLAERKKMLSGKVEELTLPTHLEDVSSTQIRENIDDSRDISSLIDPVVQNYIYDLSLYMRAPQYKNVFSERFMDFSTKKEGERTVLTLRDGGDENGYLASTSVVQVVTANLYEEFQDQKLSAFIREHALGKILVIKSFQGKDCRFPGDNRQIVLTETLSDALKDDFSYAVYHPEDPREMDETTLEILQLQGFREVKPGDRSTGIYAVDMRNPVVVFQNMDKVLKNPFDYNPKVEQIIFLTHKRLQKALAGLYPGSLILSFNSGVMYGKLIKKVTAANHVPSTPLKERKLGPNMCVPFGRIMKTTVFPNTVTKTLHTEKSFSPDLTEFTVKEYPFYASIPNQIRTIRSFNRPVILVDDLLHKGYRMKSLDPVLKENGVKVEKLIVGLLSGSGKDLMTEQQREVDSAYFVPNLRAWFVESLLYPFMGGDGVARSTDTVDDAFTAINLIMPYVKPRFLRNTDEDALFHFSQVCLENVRDIFKVIEEEYQNVFQRKLTLDRLSEVILFPRLPDVGQCLDYDRSVSASAYIESDIERLIRLKGLGL